MGNVLVEVVMIGIDVIIKVGSVNVVDIVVLVVVVVDVVEMTDLFCSHLIPLKN